MSQKSNFIPSVGSVNLKHPALVSLDWVFETSIFIVKTGDTITQNHDMLFYSDCPSIRVKTHLDKWRIYACVN